MLIYPLIAKCSNNLASLLIVIYLNFFFSSSMNEVVHTSPTIGSNVEEIVINNTRFLMWDIGGQESLRSSWNTYYTNTEVMFLNILKLLRTECLGNIF